MATLALEGIQKRYGQVRAVDNIDLDVADGEFLAILGPSGCGKSTTMRMISGLETPTEGKVLIGGKDVTKLPPRARNVAMVFQSYALYPSMTVIKNITFPLKANGVPKDQWKAKVDWAVDTMGIGHLLDRKPGRLSGGEKQRVALARALVRDPELFIFDEPLSALDAQVRSRARTELRGLHDRTGVTTVYVTHDQVEALSMGDRVAIMKDGKVRQVGTPHELYNHPADTFVASFIGAPPMNLLHRNGRILGFRPEYLFPENDPHVDSATGLAIDMHVERLEFVGATWLVYGRTGGDDADKVMARVPPSTARNLREGEHYKFVVQNEWLRWFDANTGVKVSDATV